MGIWPNLVLSTNVTHLAAVVPRHNLPQKNNIKTLRSPQPIPVPIYSQDISAKMASLIPFLLLLLSSIVSAIPTPVQNQSTLFPPPWDSGTITEYPIHSSCNATQRLQIETGLNETIALAAHAKEHILRWGNESSLYRKYFGNRPSFEPIGIYELLGSGDKDSVLFRCDNPDGKCDNDGLSLIRCTG